MLALDCMSVVPCDSDFYLFNMHQCDEELDQHLNRQEFATFLRDFIAATRLPFHDVMDFLIAHTISHAPPDEEAAAVEVSALESCLQ